MPHTETHNLEWERLYERNRESQIIINTGEERLNISEISTQFKKLEKSWNKFMSNKKITINTGNNKMGNSA